MCCVNSNIIPIYFEVAFLVWSIPLGPGHVFKTNVSVNVPVPYSDMLQMVSSFNTVRNSQGKPLLLRFFEGAVVFGDGDTKHSSSGTISRNCFTSVWACPITNTSKSSGTSSRTAEPGACRVPPFPRARIHAYLVKPFVTRAE